MKIEWEGQKERIYNRRTLELKLPGTITWKNSKRLRVKKRSVMRKEVPDRGRNRKRALSASTF